MIDWNEVFQEAFTAAWGDQPRPIPGAKFRQIVAKIVSARGSVFPPPNSGKFSKFLGNFPEMLLVQGHPGEDVLVVPADRPDLLASGKGLSGRVRADIFTALTRFTNSSSFYFNPKTDSILEVKSGDVAPPDAIALPPTTFEGEVGLRKDFARETDIPESLRFELLQSLDAPRPLTSFSEALRIHGLSKEWHHYRVGVVVEKLRLWAAENKLLWSPSWLMDSESTVTAAPIPSVRFEQDMLSLIQALAGQVSEADISRISVPLDIVLKLVSQKR